MTQTSSTVRSTVRGPGILLGVGLGGFVDGIVLLGALLIAGGLAMQKQEHSHFALAVNREGLRGPTVKG